GGVCAQGGGGRLVRGERGDVGGDREEYPPRQHGDERDDRGETIGTRRKIDDERVELSPGGVCQELAQRLSLHRAPPRVGFLLRRRPPVEWLVVRGQQQGHRQYRDSRRPAGGVRGGSPG